MRAQFLLPICLALSLALHLAFLALTGFWISPIAGSFSQLRSDYGIQVRLVPFVNDSSLPVAIAATRDESASDRVMPGPAMATQSPSSGLLGDEAHKPVVPLSMDDYLPRSRLEKVPKLIGSVDASVDFRGMTGVVGEAEIVLLISSDGDVDEVVMIESTLPNFLVDKVVSNFRRAKFEPGMIGSVAVRSRLRIRFQPPSSDELLGNPSSARERAWR